MDKNQILSVAARARPSSLDPDINQNEIAKDESYAAAPQVYATHTQSSFSSLSSVNRFSLFQALRRMTTLKGGLHAAGSNQSKPYLNCVQTLSELIGPTEALILRLQKEAPNYDFDENTPGNGYRSIISIVDCVVHGLIGLLHSTNHKPITKLFTADKHSQLLQNYVQIFRFFSYALPLILQLMDNNAPGELLAMKAWQKANNDILLSDIDKLDNTCFYAHSHAFQFVPSLTVSFGMISKVLAAYNRLYKKRITPAALISSVRLCADAKYRAKRLVNISRTTDIQFLKAFWNLAENDLAVNVPLVFACSPRLAYNKTFNIDCEQTFYLDTDNNETLQVMPPTHCNTVTVRLLSAKLRGNMKSSSLSEVCSPNLLFHCHGGGFVATSSKSHQSYLRHWAVELDCPILSVDYSLAPENGYPRPTEEVLYAYVWALHNKEKIGWSGERVCWVGDSAGGNLLASVLVRCAVSGVQAMPQGMVFVYTPFLLQYTPSPSRLLHMMDPLLPMGIVMRCILAYTSGTKQMECDSESKSGKELSNDSQNEADPFETLISQLGVLHESCANPELSPIYCTSQVLQTMPPAWFLCGHLDPLLDDTISFAKKLRDAGGQVRAVHLLDDLPHGFLNFNLISPEAKRATKETLNCIKQCFNMAVD